MHCPRVLKLHQFQSISVLETFFLAMLHYPDVYRKAQEEIDRVIGNERLPDFTDRYSLPYLEALVTSNQPGDSGNAAIKIGGWNSDQHRGSP